MKICLPKLIAIGLFMAGFQSHAQLKFPVTNNELRNNLSRVISDFPSQFSALKGDTISSSPQTIEFATRLDFKEAENNSIIEYKSAHNPIYSWQAVLLNTEDFEEASKKYKWLYNQLKVMTVKLEEYSFTLSGEYDAPDESKKFSSSIFKLTPNASNLPKLKIEASMQFEFPEWKVSLLVYEREREDNERGDINGD